MIDFFKPPKKERFFITAVFSQSGREVIFYSFLPQPMEWIKE